MGPGNNYSMLVLGDNVNMRDTLVELLTGSTQLMTIQFSIPVRLRSCTLTPTGRFSVGTRRVEEVRGSYHLRGVGVFILIIWIYYV